MNIKIKLTTFIFCLIAFLNLSLQAQDKTIENILSVELKNIGAIKKGNEVSGYYLFYEVDKKDKKTRVYSLQILDENLELVAKKRMTKSIYTNLVDAAFNDSLIMFKFYDSKEKKISFKAYDMQGVRARGGSRSFDKNKIYSPSIFAIPSKGFIQYASVKNEKRGYIVEFLAPVRENAWKYKSDRKAETFQSAGYITATQNILISKIAVSKNIFGKDSHNSILALDVNTGKKIFETDLGTKVPVDITNGFIDEANKEITVFGLYYKKGDKIVKDKSKGLFAYALDFEGKIKTTKYLSWEDNVNPFLPMDKRGKSNNPQFLYFHDIIKTKDGKIIAVGEQFYKAVSGKAVALKMLSSIITGSSRGRLQSSSKGGVSKLVIGDLSLFTFDKDFNLEGVNFVEKSKSDFYGPSDFSSAQVIALFAKIEGAFDYSFTQTNEDHSIIIINYLDYERRTGEKNGYTLGAINYVDGSFTTDKVKFDGEVDKVKIFPAKHGYVCIVEINHQKKKMNTLKMRLEKINY